jgi:hypothetical protein
MFFKKSIILRMHAFNIAIKHFIKKKKFIYYIYFNILMLNIKEYEKIQDECKSIAISKNKNYGSEGLYKYGVKGIVMRMNDKMDRLHNLTWCNQTDLVDESIEDTAKDMINYAIYIILLQKNLLEENKIQSELHRSIKFDTSLKRIHLVSLK